MVKINNFVGAATQVVTKTEPSADVPAQAQPAEGRVMSSASRELPPPAQDSVRTSSSTGADARMDLEQRVQKLEETLKEQASQLSKQISGGAQRVEVERDDRSGRFVMTVIDSESGQVLRQFPPESVMKVNERLDQLSGMLLALEA